MQLVDLIPLVLLIFLIRNLLHEDLRSSLKAIHVTENVF